MFDFVRRPATIREISEVPKMPEVTEIDVGFGLLFDTGDFDTKREAIRKSLKAFNGQVFSSATYKHKLEMEIHFLNAEKKAEWLKHAKEIGLISS